jgi:hypothetical protein
MKPVRSIQKNTKEDNMSESEFWKSEEGQRVSWLRPGEVLLGLSLVVAVIVWIVIL